MKALRRMWLARPKDILTAAFKFEYVLLVPVKGKNMKIKFDDWIFMQDERVAINRATMTKFGIKVAELTVMFVKD